MHPVWRLVVLPPVDVMELQHCTGWQNVRLAHALELTKRREMLLLKACLQLYHPVSDNVIWLTGIASGEVDGALDGPVGVALSCACSVPDRAGTEHGVLVAIVKQLQAPQERLQYRVSALCTCTAASGTAQSV